MAAALTHNLLPSRQSSENAAIGSANSKQSIKRKFDNNFESEHFQKEDESVSNPMGRVLVQLRSENGAALDAPLDLELAVTPEKLQTLVHALLKQVLSVFFQFPLLILKYL